MRILSQSQTAVKQKPNLLLTNKNTQPISNLSKTKANYLLMRILSQSQTIVKPKPNLLLTNENTQSI